MQKKKKRRHDDAVDSTQTSTPIKKQKTHGSCPVEGAPPKAQSPVKSEPTSPKREVETPKLTSFSSSFVPRSVKVEHVAKVEKVKEVDLRKPKAPQSKAVQKSAKQAPKAKKPAIPKNGNYSRCCLRCVHIFLRACSAQIFHVRQLLQLGSYFVKTQHRDIISSVWDVGR